MNHSILICIMEKAKGIKRLLFTLDEDVLIKKRVDELGLQKACIVLEVELQRPRRIIKEHYSNALNPILNPVFTEEEDMLLIRLVEEYGNKWEIISKTLGNKSQSQAKGRHKLLLTKLSKGQILPNGKRTIKFVERNCRERRNRTVQIEERTYQEYVYDTDIVTPELAKDLVRLWDKIDINLIFE